MVICLKNHKLTVNDVVVNLNYHGTKQNLNNIYSVKCPECNCVQLTKYALNNNENNNKNNNKNNKKIISDYQYIKDKYRNLRQCYDLVTERVLGKDYYNMGMDVFQCDRETCYDIINRKVKILLKDKNTVNRASLKLQLNEYILELSHINETKLHNNKEIQEIIDKLNHIL